MNEEKIVCKVILKRSVETLEGIFYFFLSFTQFWITIFIKTISSYILFSCCFLNVMWNEYKADIKLWMHLCKSDETVNEIREKITCIEFGCNEHVAHKDIHWIRNNLSLGVYTFMIIKCNDIWGYKMCFAEILLYMDKSING